MQGCPAVDGRKPARAGPSGEPGSCIREQPWIDVEEQVLSLGEHACVCQPSNHRPETCAKFDDTDPPSGESVDFGTQAIEHVRIDRTIVHGLLGREVATVSIDESSIHRGLGCVMPALVTVALVLMALARPTTFKEAAHFAIMRGDRTFPADIQSERG